MVIDASCCAMLKVLYLRTLIVEAYMAVYDFDDMMAKLRGRLKQT
jgi:hypothetical protein